VSFKDILSSVVVANLDPSFVALLKAFFKPFFNERFNEKVYHPGNTVSTTKYYILYSSLDDTQ